MKTTTITFEDIERSVLAVPPFARNADYEIASGENARLVRHLENGGITTIMYGGNANIYNMSMAQFARFVDELPQWAGKDTWVIPSIGPAFGQMMDQAEIAGNHPYPTLMVLPLMVPKSSPGVEIGLRRVAEKFKKPIIIYLKEENYLSVEQVKSLVDDGMVVAIKYAIQRSDPSIDEYLQALIEVVDPRRVISGIGERPAIVHLEQFGLPVFTTGSGSVAPKQSTALLKALRTGQGTVARQLRERFLPLEDLRDSIDPIRVLHEAVTLAGVAEMGPALPLLSNLEEQEKGVVERAACKLVAQEETLP